MHAPQTLALAIVLCAAVAHGAAPTTNYVNTWTYNPTAKTFDAGTTGTATTCVATEDQFPNKGVVSYANFKVTYHKTYKIVENKAANKKYLLHQRGCTKSTDATVTALKAEAAYAGEFEIPLKSVAVASTTYFPFMEQIGERPAMRVYTSFNAGHGTTPCMQKQWADGWIKLSSDSNAATVEATFGSTATGAGAIVMSDTAEPTFYGMSEWAEFMALWFNREQKVATLTDTVRSNWLQCKAENSKQLATATAKPKVLFVEYYFFSYPTSGTFKGWSVEPCHKCDDGSMPVLTNVVDGNGVWKCGVSGKGATTLAGSNRYCELIEAAGGQVMQNHVLANSAVQANPTVPQCGCYPATTACPACTEINPWPVGPWAGGGAMAGGLSGYNNAQLESVAKDVDIIIVKTGGCGCKWSTPACTAQECSDKFRDEFQRLTGIPAVANKKVFDFYGTVDPKGGNAMLSGAGLSVDVLLQDFIKAISGDTSQTTKDHTYHFLRDNFAVGSWGDLFVCDTTGAPTIGCTPPSAADIADTCTDTNAIAADSLTAPKCKNYIEPASAQCFHNGLLLEEGAQLGSLFSFEDDGVLVVHVLPSPKPPMQPRSASPLFPSEAYACAAVLAARKRRAARLVAAGLVLALACVAARGAPRKGVGPQCNSVNEDSRAKRPTLLANEHSHEIGGGVLTHLTHLRTAPTLPISQPSASAASAGAFEWPRFMPRPVVARNSSSIRPRTPVSSRPGGAGASPVAATSALAEPRPMLRLDAWLQAGRQKVVSVAAKHTAEWLQAGRKNAARAVHGAVAAARKGWSVACDALATLLLALLAKFKGVKKQP